MQAIEKQKKPILKGDNIALICVFICFIILVALVNPRFISWMNIKNILLQVAVTGILTMGMMLVMISGGIDLSIAWMIAFLGCGGAYMLIRLNVPVFMVLLSMIAVSVAFQGIMGFIISRLNLEPFIVSLGFMSIYKSFAYLITDGSEIPMKGALSKLNCFPMGVSLLVYFFIIIALIMFLVLTYTKYGKRVYAVGCNPDAAYLSGIDVKNLKLSVYMINGVLIGLGAVLLVSRLDTGTLTLSAGQEIDAIAACVVGGVALNGGKGRVFGVVIGIIFLGCISNAMTLMSVSSYIADLMKGLIIVISVIFSNFAAIKEKINKIRR